MLPFFQTKPNDLPNMLNEFSKQVFAYWNELYNTPTIHVQDVKRQILWHISSTCADAKPVYYTFWMEKGILTVADITKNNGILYKYDELMNKYRM